MPIRNVLVAAVVLLLLGGLTLLQPSYFLAKPSLYSLFSAFVADRGVRVERGITYGSHARQKLDVYSPDDVAVAKSSPVVVFFYGGTWKEGERSIYGFVGAALAARGITAVVPDYRLFPEVQFPAFVDDAARAYVWARRNYPDPSRPVFVMGHSAGAHMAVMLACNPSYVRTVSTDIAMPEGMIGLAGPYIFDLTTYPTTKDLFPDDQPAAETIPGNFVTSAAPRSLLIHGSADETVKLANQRILAEKLRDLDVEVETHEPEGETHVGVIRALAWPFRNQSAVLELIVAFVRKNSLVTPK